MASNAAVHRGLTNGCKGEDVSKHQEGLVDQIKHLNYELHVVIDGEDGPQTLRATRIVARSLGVRGKAWRKLKHGRIPESTQKLVRAKRHATNAERKAAKRRKGYRRSVRKRLKGGPNKAVQWANQYVGVTENPPGSNRGPYITHWADSLGFPGGGVPWCGIFLGSALHAAGVKVTSRVAGVANIEDDAKAGTNGFKQWLSPTQGKRGDALVLFGRGVHTELVRWRTPLGYFTTGGNTSSGSSGSQDNGGGVFKRFRPFSDVYGVARPDYP